LLRPLVSMVEICRSTPSRGRRLRHQHGAILTQRTYAIMGRASVLLVGTLVLALQAWTPFRRTFAALATNIAVPPRAKPPVCYEVHYLKSQDALNAAEQLDNTELGWGNIRVTLDPETEHQRTVNVQGVTSDKDSKDVQAFFEQMGPVELVEKGEDNLFGEVQFRTEEDAWRAKNELDGSELLGKKVSVHLEVSNPPYDRILVHGLSGSIEWQELKDHFSPCGPVKRADVHGGLVGRIRYYSWEEAWDATKTSKKKFRRNTRIRVGRDYQGRGKKKWILVHGLPKDAEEWELRDQFGRYGNITEVRIETEEVPSEFWV